MALKQTTPPTTTIVSVEEVKRHLRLDLDDDDDDIADCIRDAERFAENYTGRQFLTATWTETRDCFPAWEWQSPRVPTQSITSVTYVASSDGSTATMPSSEYRLAADGVTAEQRGMLTPAYNEEWPDARFITDAAKVEWVLGSTSSTDVPREARRAVTMLAAEWYSCGGGAREIGGTALSMLNMIDTGTYR